jgi:hypothetical protein
MFNAASELADATADRRRRQDAVRAGTIAGDRRSGELRREDIVRADLR